MKQLLSPLVVRVSGRRRTSSMTALAALPGNFSEEVGESSAAVRIVAVPGAARGLLVGGADEPSELPMIALARTVLVVDDESLIRWALHDHLARAGYSVLEAESGWTAAAHLGVDSRGRDVHLVLLDYVIPGGGFQFIEWVREAFPRTKIILMTSAVTPDLVENARTREVRIVIAKPFDAVEVVRLVTKELTPEVGTPANGGGPCRD